MKAWIWSEGEIQPYAWQERRLQPWSKHTPHETIEYRQFPIFPTKTDARNWARAHRRAEGAPQPIEIL